MSIVFETPEQIKASKKLYYGRVIDELLTDLAKDGFVLTVHQVPLKPLAMGNYETVFELGDKR